MKINPIKKYAVKITGIKNGSGVIVNQQRNPIIFIY